MGRPSKGARRMIGGKIPQDLATLFLAKVGADDITVHLTAAIAAYTGYKPTNDTQEALPLPNS